MTITSFTPLRGLVFSDLRRVKSMQQQPDMTEVRGPLPFRLIQHDQPTNRIEVNSALIIIAFFIVVAGPVIFIVDEGVWRTALVDMQVERIGWFFSCALYKGLAGDDAAAFDVHR
jgi:hypothetical protein